MTTKQEVINTLDTEYNFHAATVWGIEVVYNLKWNEYRVTDPKTRITYLFKTSEEAIAKAEELHPVGPILRRLRALAR